MTTIEFNVKCLDERIKIQENSREEIEDEIRLLEKVYSQVKEIFDITMPRTIVFDELKAFLKRLEEQININRELSQEISRGIEYIRGQKHN